MNRIDNVIYEIATNTTFVKAKANALNIDKLILSFVEFDSKTKQSKGNIDIYLDAGEALAFAQEVLSGKIPTQAVREKKRCNKEKAQYPNAVYFSPLGGISEENAKKRNLRTDGKAISRQFNFAPGAKADFVFTAIQKPGHTDTKTKLIIPEKNSKPEILIRVACSARDLKILALMLQTHIQAFYTAKYATGGYDSQYFAESKNSPTPNTYDSQYQGNSNNYNNQQQSYYPNRNGYNQYAG